MVNDGVFDAPAVRVLLKRNQAVLCSHSTAS